MRNYLFNLQFRLFFWLGRRIFKSYCVWYDGLEVTHKNFKPIKSCRKIEVLTFTNVKNWQRRHKRSKKFFGIETAKQMKNARATT